MNKLKIKNMKNLKWISALLISMTIMSCAGDAEFENMTFNDGQYSMAVPDYMKSLELGNQDASMQYGNEIKEHYVMVIAETKESLLAAGLDYSVEDYADFAVGFLKKSLTDPKAERINEEVKNINGLEAISFKVRGVFTDIDEDIFYYITIYKSENNYYSMSTWTLGARESRYTETMEAMINSFKEN